jgi:uncharacterized membrane protein YhiD involved in acid resistance
MNLLDQLQTTLSSDLTPRLMLIKLVLALAATQVLAWHYLAFSKVLSNKPKFARVLVFMGVTTMLVITVVKSSLALSLGLVGALSIIRFRTPVKEAEELAYLFLAIAAGIGIGADQEVITLLAFIVILAYLSISKTTFFSVKSGQSLLQVTLPVSEGGSSAEDLFKHLKDELLATGTPIHLQRVDRYQDTLNTTWVISAHDDDLANTLLSSIQKAMPQASMTLVDKASLD